MLQKSGIPKLFFRMEGMKDPSLKIDRFNETSWTCTSGGSAAISYDVHSYTWFSCQDFQHIVKIDFWEFQFDFSGTKLAGISLAQWGLEPIPKKT